MKSDEFGIELESKIDNLPVIGKFINDALDHFKADAGSIYKVQLAVDEACTNIINYAYSEKVGAIKINLALVGEDIVVTIKDKGKPFDPTSIPSPEINSDVEHRKIGGLGIYFMKQLMDSVSYSFDPQEGNKLILRKRKSSATSSVD